MTKIQRKRLLKLADFIVEQVPEDQFDMGQFGPLSGCGTAGCAIGWCTVLFKRAGVRMVTGIPVFQDLSGISIAMPLFGLTSVQAYTLFSGKNAGKSAKQVRREIFKLVSKTK